MYGMALALKRQRAKELLSEVIMMTLNDAVRRIKEAYFDARVLSIDGVLCASDGNFDPNRVGVVIEEGYVTGAQIG
jgi:hypothetical protein